MALWNESVVWNQADRQLDDSVFGTLHWDFADGTWLAESKITESLPVPITLCFDDDRSQNDFDPTRRLPDARRLWPIVVETTPRSTTRRPRMASKSTPKFDINFAGFSTSLYFGSRRS